uniref:Pre-mRNA splicing Prp18-interacting factor n=1 Tax=Tanacetum cinerariifolium TaxID=118510 RepID=A0A6L2KWX6_TANCI|nr:hypothetical protein [Tanacetum cinerariifolium]
MNLFNESCDNCIYGDGKPITCNECEGMLKGGFCLPCNLKAKNSFICYPNAYSFNDTSNNSNYLPQPQYDNYLCNLLGYNSHDGYDCQQQFPFVYEQEPSYNKNYDDNYYPHESPSFPCCDNCGESHETFQCQPMDQNIYFSSSDQIQTQQYLEVHPPFQEISDEVFHAKGDLMKSIQTFLEEFNCIPFKEKATILLQVWFSFFAIMHDHPENSNELFQKLLEYLKELAEYKESLENSSKEIAVSNSNQEPPQDSDIRQLIREECCIEVCEEQKKNTEDTILELVEIFQDKRECDLHVCENSLICDDHFEIFSDSKNDDNISIDDDDFEDIEYVEASLSDPEIVSVEEENVVYQEEEEIDLKDISQIQDMIRQEYYSFCFEIEPDLERLINVLKNDISNDSTRDALLEEADLFLSDNPIPPGTENFADDLEGDICLLEALLIDNSIPFPNNELSDDEASDFDNPSVPLPPSEPPDFDFALDAGDEISVVMNVSDELECIDAKVEFDNDDYSSFMFVKVFSFLLSAESEDTIFDPGKDCAQNVKNQSKIRQYRTQDGKSTAKAGSTGIFLKEIKQ